MHSMSADESNSLKHANSISQLNNNALIGTFLYLLTTGSMPLLVVHRSASLFTNRQSDLSDHESFQLFIEICSITILKFINSLYLHMVYILVADFGSLFRYFEFKNYLYTIIWGYRLLKFVFELMLLMRGYSLKQVYTCSKFGIGFFVNQD